MSLSPFQSKQQQRRTFDQADDQTNNFSSEFYPPSVSYSLISSSSSFSVGFIPMARMAQPSTQQYSRDKCIEIVRPHQLFSVDGSPAVYVELIERLLELRHLQCSVVTW